MSKIIRRGVYESHVDATMRLPDGRMIRTYIAECVVNTTAVLEGHFNDWPANIQDGLYRALENIKLTTGRDYHIVMSRSDRDVDSGPYIHVIAAATVFMQ